MTLTNDDLQAIKMIVTTAVCTSEERMTGKIDGVEQGLTAKIDGVEQGLTAKIDGVEQGLTAKIDGVERNLNERIDASKEELLAEIQDVGADVAATKAVLLEHVSGSRVWKH